MYKRRVCLPLQKAREFLAQGGLGETSGQIDREIAYFLRFYGPLAPAMYIGCDRVAYAVKEQESEKELRITFDTNLCMAQGVSDFPLQAPAQQLLQPGQRLMEIKVPGAFPLWLSHALDSLQIYPASFSKYSSAFLKTRAPQGAQQNTGGTNCA